MHWIKPHLKVWLIQFGKPSDHSKPSCHISTYFLFHHPVALLEHEPWAVFLHIKDTFSGLISSCCWLNGWDSHTSALRFHQPFEFSNQSLCESVIRRAQWAPFACLQDSFWWLHSGMSFYTMYGLLHLHYNQPNPFWSHYRTAMLYLLQTLMPSWPDDSLKKHF